MKDAAPPPPPEGFDPISQEALSPMMRTIGARLVQWSDGGATMQAHIIDAVINRQGLLHGGAIMTLMDSTGGYAGTFCPYPNRLRRAVTLSMTTNFLSSAKEGLVRAQAKVTGGGRSVFFTDISLRSAEGALLATATATYKRRSGSESLFGQPRGAD